MYCPPSYQLYRCEHGISVAEQRAADVRAGAAAAAVRDLLLELGRAFSPMRRVRSARRMAGAMSASARVLASSR
jgi:hypothetical protein